MGGSSVSREADVPNDIVQDGHRAPSGHVADGYQRPVETLVSVPTRSHGQWNQTDGNENGADNVLRIHQNPQEAPRHSPRVQEPTNVPRQRVAASPRVHEPMVPPQSSAFWSDFAFVTHALSLCTSRHGIEQTIQGLLHWGREHGKLGLMTAAAAGTGQGAPGLARHGPWEGQRTDGDGYRGGDGDAMVADGTPDAFVATQMQSTHTGQLDRFAYDERDDGEMVQDDMAGEQPAHAKAANKGHEEEEPAGPFYGTPDECDMVEDEKTNVPTRPISTGLKPAGSDYVTANRRSSGLRSEYVERNFGRSTFAWSTHLARLMYDTFGHRGFRPMQEAVMNAAIMGKSVLALMPTGGGKSACFQVPGVFGKSMGDYARGNGSRYGVTVILSPLIALIKDQVDSLKQHKISVVAFSSDKSTAEINSALRSWCSMPLDEGHFVYVTPERFCLNMGFRSILAELRDVGRLHRIVIDEAHCVSKWGHDFRPHYIEMGRVVRDEFPDIPLLALTATASEKVREDVLAALWPARDRYPLVFWRSFNRPNLKYVVQKRVKTETVMEALKQHKNQVGIIYCRTKKACETMQQKLKKERVKCEYYHAGMSEDQRATVQHRWSSGELDVIIATIAFGMGIDKANVRFVIHCELPKSPEGYYQESGRAGRDGEPSVCYLFYSQGDSYSLLSMILQAKSSATECTKIRDVLRMELYACEAFSCRRQVMLAFLGEEFDRRRCGSGGCRCDNCDLQYGTKRLDVTELVAPFVSLLSSGVSMSLSQMTSVAAGIVPDKYRRQVGSHKACGCGKRLSFTKVQVREYLVRMCIDDVFQPHVTRSKVRGRVIVCVLWSVSPSARNNPQRRYSVPVVDKFNKIKLPRQGREKRAASKKGGKLALTSGGGQPGGGDGEQGGAGGRVTAAGSCGRAEAGAHAVVPVKKGGRVPMSGVVYGGREGVSVDVFDDSGASEVVTAAAAAVSDKDKLRRGGLMDVTGGKASRGTKKGRVSRCKPVVLSYADDVSSVDEFGEEEEGDEAYIVGSKSASALAWRGYPLDPGACDGLLSLLQQRAHELAERDGERGVLFSEATLRSVVRHLPRTENEVIDKRMEGFSISRRKYAGDVVDVVLGFLAKRKGGGTSPMGSYGHEGASTSPSARMQASGQIRLDDDNIIDLLD